MQLLGKRALITGSSRGIGFGFAQALASRGCAVVLNHYGDAQRAEDAMRTLEGGNGVRNHVYCIEADVGDPSSARSLVTDAAKLLGGLDLVISNAGICQFTKFIDLTDAAWARHVNVNFSAGFYIGQAAARLMIQQGTGGRIVYTTSVGAIRSNATQTHYCATKGGLELLAKGMALELAPYGITVNCIAPGWIHTAINDAASRDTHTVQAWLSANCPVGRLGTPNDLQSALLFLCDADSGYVNGTTVCVDGGWNAQL